MTENNAYGHVVLCKKASYDESVASIVSGPRKDEDAFWRKTIEYKRGDTVANAFHKFEAMNAQLYKLFIQRTNSSRRIPRNHRLFPFRFDHNDSCSDAGIVRNRKKKAGFSQIIGQRTALRNE